MKKINKKTVLSILKIIKFFLDLAIKYLQDNIDDTQVAQQIKTLDLKSEFDETV